MTYAGRSFAVTLAFAFAAATTLAATLAPVSQASAQGIFTQPRYAAIVVDANTGEVLYDRRADELRHPASITKIMTLYLTFEALATGRLSMGERITVSPHAYAQAPSKTRLQPGQSLTVDQAIRVTAVHSANDIAVALAERLGGSESHFAQLMTLRAQELGMRNTHFANASGLPNPQQISTARDISILSRAVMRDYPQYYSYFGQKTLDFEGQVMQNHNHLLTKMPGVDGIKTGYVSAAGFNLSASAVRNGKRLIAVVLGGPSTAARDENVEELLNAGFNVLNRRNAGLRMTIASLMSEPQDLSGPVERPPVEEGSGDQPDLKVVVQPQIRTMPMMAAAQTLAAAPSAPSHMSVGQPALREAVAAPCHAARRHRRRHAACESETVQTAKAEPAKAAKPAKADAGREEAAEAKPCTSRQRRRHPAACEADLQVAAKGAGKHEREAEKKIADKDDAKSSAKGGFMIQVGAYKNQGQAKDHLDKVASDYGHLVGSGAQVEKSSGNYRVRFRGLTEAKAKAACHSLAAKGQQCMVMAAS
jgi:D-alanyl-D-alanine carboxypeptidase (penicillin-binding protein 5/6)